MQCLINETFLMKRFLSVLCMVVVLLGAIIAYVQLGPIRAVMGIQKCFRSGDMASLAAVDLGVGMSVGAGSYRQGQVTAGESHSCAILIDKSIKCWGRNVEGQLVPRSLEPRSPCARARL